MEIDIDGSYLEGGGQIVRTAVALSAITRKSVHLFNIRKGRQNPGLKPQHLVGIKTAARLCEAETWGVTQNSLEFSFHPGFIIGGNFQVDTRTAGAITLILQTLIPIALFSPRPVVFNIKGGTAVPFSPSILYTKNIFGAYLTRFGAKVSIQVLRHGFYPKGGGAVMVKVFPSQLRSISISERGSLKRVEAFVVASKRLRQNEVAERVVKGFKDIISEARTHIEYVDTTSPGCFIHCQAEFEGSMIGAGSLGKKGKPAEKVGEEAARELNRAFMSDAPVDPWLVDQLIPYMALATYRTGIESRMKIPELTRHARTNIWIVQKFLRVEFEVKDNIMSCISRSQKKGIEGD